VAIKLLSLNGVDNNEACEIRTLLNENDINYYETPGRNFAFIHGAIWLVDSSQFGKAQELITKYQAQRENNAKITYGEAVTSGEIKSFFQRVKDNIVVSAFWAIGILIVVIGFIAKVFERI